MVTYNVVLHVNNDNLQLRPGMTANVQILIEEVKNALSLPEQAFRFSPGKGARERDTKEKPPLKPYERRVWRLDGAGKLTPVLVKIGISGTRGVQVISNEIKPGNSIVVEAVAKDKKTRRMRGMGFRF